MPIHDRVLQAAWSICRERGDWTFRPAEVAAALPELNLASVRTHVMSRCCVNAPSHHAHRWPYFRRIRRGVYEILPAWRGEGQRQRSAGRAVAETPVHNPERKPTPADSGIWDVRESAAGYLAAIPGTRETVRASSLDELTEHLRRIARKRREAGAGSGDPLQLRVEVALERVDPILEAYEKDIDRTLIRGTLAMSFEERLLALERWMNAVEEIRGTARRADGETAG